MLKDLQKKLRDEGFTIIEVMIVLAIAGVIIVIVLVVIPTVQRNSRNQQIRSDATNMIGYINEYITNNNGALPTAANFSYTAATGAVCFAPAPCTEGAGAYVGKIRANLASVTAVAPPTAASNAAATNTLVINLNRKCNAGNVDAATTNRAVAVSYQTETGGTPTTQCAAS
jgi:prepilin-type N-terminal cleavage/methylation domain-containing protein